MPEWFVAVDLQNWNWELVKSSEHLVTNHFSPNPSNDLKMRTSK